MKCLSNLKFVYAAIAVVLVVILGLCGLPCSCDTTKECTNRPNLTSHTLREQLLNSNDQTWKEEVYSHYHLTPTDDSAWSGLIPRKVLRGKEDEFYWAVMYRQLKNQAGLFNVPSGLLKEVSLHNVRLDAESFHGQAQQTNLEYLLMLDPDRLVWSFRKTAGLPTSGMPYGGWETPTGQLRGHFVGHYMSASAQMWASTHNDSLREKMSAVVSLLADCQNKMGTGYLSAFPSEFFDRFEAIKLVWAPYYTIHKILAGLLDQHEFAANSQALRMGIWMVEYFYTRVQNVILKYSITQHWKSINEETGGMNDVLYRLYSITRNQKHLLLAHLFDKPCFLGLLAVQANDLSNFHANTHIPIVVGSQMRYEVTGDPLYMAIGTFFMDIVNTSYSYATGGTSVHEFWSDPKRLASTLEAENQESCTTYNMLKVSRNLFRWSREVTYADYYERALTNGVLGNQRGQDPGIMIYMLPLGRGVSKATSHHHWGTQFNSFWCCYGTGIESFSKLGDSIYFEEEGSIPGLYIIQYISSSLNWKSGQIAINQIVEPVSSWDPHLRVSLIFSRHEAQGAGQTSILNLRIPSWTSDDAKATLDGESLSVPGPGNFLKIRRKWSSGNKLTMQFPIALRTEAIKDDRPEYASIQAILFGPYLLAGLSSGDWDIKTGSAVSSFSDCITAVPASYNSLLITLSQEVHDSKFLLANTNSLITMENFPETGTNSAVHATFRVVAFPGDHTSAGASALEDVVGLEPYDFPGMLIAHQGPSENVVIEKSDGRKASCAFRLVKGVDGKDRTVSLESENAKGCYLYSAAEFSSRTSIVLNCTGDSYDDGFKKAASFVLNEGMSEYHPISFIARGANRNFMLAPLMSLRDELYTVYFNIQT